MQRAVGAAAPAVPPSGGPRPGQDIVVTVEDVAQGGWCVARPAGLPVMFVRHALPGERVTARVTDVTSKFARAEAVEVLDPSPDRVTPPCRHAGPGGCGGCDWQHATLPAQRALKGTVLRQQLKRLAGIDHAVTVEPLGGDASGDGLGWRTRVQYAVSADGVAGLRAHRSHRVIGIGDCLIAHEGIRELAIGAEDWTGALGVEVAVGTADAAENFAVTVVEGGGAGKGRRGRGAGPSAVKRTLVEGRAYLAEYAAGRLWQVSADGFWQVHPAAADALSQAVVAALAPEPGDDVLDLYCGAGLFAGVIAPLVGKDGTVTGIDADAGAVASARRNVSDCAWVTFRRADVARAARDGALPRARLVVADPPRAGLARELVGYLTGGSQAERFAYVSCDPATLARDLALLIAGGWRLADLRAFDAFPMTHHMECVAALTRLTAPRRRRARRVGGPTGRRACPRRGPARPACGRLASPSRSSRGRGSG